MRITVILLLTAALIAQPVLLSAAGMATSVIVTSNPDSMVADGKSVTTITAEVRELSGRPVADGTLISFSTDIGTIQSTVSTTAGVARVRLTSGTTVGTATISAWVTTGGAVGQLKVELLAPGTEISRQAFLTISARYLVYDPEKSVIEASGGVKISHRGLMISADEAQVDVQAGVLKCRMASGGEPIHLSKSRRSLDVQVLVYRLKEGKGEAMVDGASGKVQKVSVRGSDLASQPDDGYVPATYFNFVDLSESQVLVKASSIVLRPGQELRMRRAKFYVDGKKMLSMPMHVVPVGGVANEVSRYVGWGTTGLRVDLPFFYSLSANSTGSVRLRRGQQDGWGFYSGNQGWALDLVQDYTTNQGGDGGVTLNHITSGQWGAQWHHNQELTDGGQVYSYIDFPSHKDLFGMTSISKPFGNLSVGANFYGNKFHGQQLGLNSDFYVQTNPKPIVGGAANYVVRATTALASGASTGLSNGGTGLQMQLSGRPVTLAKNTNLNTSLTFGESWGSSRAGMTLLGTASIMHRLGNAGGAGLAYSFTRDNGYLGMYGQHRLSGSLFYAPSKRWQANISGTYTLDKPMSSSFADLSYQVLPGWRLSLQQTFQTYDQFNYSDTQLAIGRLIAGHEVMLVWSKSTGKLRVEFSAARF